MDHELMNMLEDLSVSLSYTSNISSLLSLAVYVFSALAIYTIAQRRGIRHPWMAWVPLINVWTLGSISDQYRYVAMGEVRNKRKVLLTINILNFILASVAVIHMIVTIVRMVMGEMSFGYEEEVVWEILSCLLWFVPVLILGIAAFIVEILALYDLYTSCDPANKVLYLVLSLIPGINQITRPLFLFLCRNQDNGMPPRRETVAENPAEF